MKIVLLGDSIRMGYSAAGGTEARALGRRCTHEHLVLAKVRPEPVAVMSLRPNLTAPSGLLVCGHFLD